MMTVDASAILAVVLGEDDADRMEATIVGAGASLISAVNYWEVLVKAQAEYGQAGIDTVDALMERMSLGVEPIDAALTRQAAAAFARFRGRPGGRLNLGDCFAYALAAREGDGLLFKGDDFPKSDVKRVLI
jgi:ribonuclease VapC